MDLLQEYRNEVEQACSACKVNELYAFGSILTDTFNADSDIDFMVSIISDDPLEYAEQYFALKFALEKIFDRKIDLLEQKAMNNQNLANEINKQKRLVYASSDQGLA